MSIFGLNATAAEMSISDVIEAIPIKAAQNISPESVATSLRELFSTKDENGNLIPPTFEEAPLSSPVAVSGCSKIEAEIFGDTLPTRRIFKGSGKSSAGSSSGNVSLEDAEQHLDALQLRKYKAALELGKTPLIQKYEAIVLQKTGSVVEKPDSRSRRSRTSPTASQTVDD
jgi:hypothetical protein